MKDLFDTFNEIRSLQSRSHSRGYKNGDKRSAKLLSTALSRLDDCENYSSDEWLNRDHLSAHDRSNHLEDAEAIVSRTGPLEIVNE